MRIEDHPILSFDKVRKRKVKFIFDGEEMYGYEGETIGAALHAAGIQEYKKSPRHGRANGFFCAIGNCSSCNMTVNGVPNVRVCVEPLKEGMVVQRQSGKGEINV